MKRKFIGLYKIKFAEVDRVPIDTLIRKLIDLRRKGKDRGMEMILDLPLEMDLEFLRYIKE